MDYKKKYLKYKKKYCRLNLRKKNLISFNTPGKQSFETKQRRITYNATRIYQGLLMTVLA